MTILDEILTYKKTELEAVKNTMPLAEIKARLRDCQPTRDFKAALIEKIQQKKPAVIAQINKASPSQGVIRADFKPAEIVKSYQSHGATCLSILTDAKYFQGKNKHLTLAREASSLPILRKDFTVDDYQIYEARMIGADCVLLIVSALTDNQLKDYIALAHELEMDALVESHTRAELERALNTDAKLIGINNRDLRNMTTDINTTINHLKMIPDDRIVISESGIHTRDDVKCLRDHGVYAFLVGEAFMRAEDPGEKLQALFFKN